MSTTAKRKDRFPYEQHVAMAEHLHAIFDDLDKLCKAVDQNNFEAKPSAKLQDQLLHLGGRANRIQAILESALSAADRNDKRSWKLYYPDDRPASRIGYAG